MSKIDEATLVKLERLARLKLSAQERSKINSDLSSIIDMFDRLNEVDTDNVEPLRHINRDIINRLREDQIDGELSCLLYTSPSPRDKRQSRMPSSA